MTFGHACFSPDVCFGWDAFQTLPLLNYFVNANLPIEIMFSTQWTSLWKIIFHTCWCYRANNFLNGSWRWCIAIWITEFLDLAYRILNNTTTRRQDLPSSPSVWTWAPTLLGPLETANLNHSIVKWLRLALSNGPNKADAPPPPYTWERTQTRSSKRCVF